MEFLAVLFLITLVYLSSLSDRKRLLSKVELQWARYRKKNIQVFSSERHPKVWRDFEHKFPAELQRLKWFVKDYLTCVLYALGGGFIIALVGSYVYSGLEDWMISLGAVILGLGLSARDLSRDECIVDAVSDMLDTYPDSY